VTAAELSLPRLISKIYLSSEASTFPHGIQHESPMNCLCRFLARHRRTRSLRSFSSIARVIICRALDLYGCAIAGWLGNSDGCLRGQRSPETQGQSAKWAKRVWRVRLDERSRAISENGFSSATAASDSEYGWSSSSSSPSSSYRGGFRCKIYRV
jgi:hypothetical protein